MPKGNLITKINFSKQIKLNNPINSEFDIYNNSIKLFNKIWNEEPVRALCVGVSDLTKTNSIQLNLFTNNIKEDKRKDKKLQETMDKINKKYDNVIMFANEINKKEE